MDFNETLNKLMTEELNEVLSTQELSKLRDPVLRKQAVDAALKKKNKKLLPNQVADFDDTGKLTIKNRTDMNLASKIGQNKIR